MATFCTTMGAGVRQPDEVWVDTELDGPGWNCLWPLGCELGEGPVWVARDQALWFVDIEAPAVHRYDPASGGRQSFPAPWRVGSIAPQRSGGFIAGTEKGFAAIDPAAGVWTLTDQPEPGRGDNRFNDGKVDPAGRFWAGSMDDTRRHASGALYRVDHDLNWTMADDGYRISNGPAFSPDGRVMYHNDTAARTTYAFDIGPDGSAHGKRVFKLWPEDFGHPDGMTVDRDGCLWMAFWGGWCLRRISPAGEVLREVQLPVSNVTSAAFGGPGCDRLFVTSARQGLDADALEVQPLAGGLFEVDAGGALGCTPVEFGG